MPRNNHDIRFDRFAHGLIVTAWLSNFRIWTLSSTGLFCNPCPAAVKARDDRARMPSP
jgi:hypothetical protein